jgi:peptidoglycan/xylan/chitin deacetylase (PgdA/CDA1 family)
VETIMSRSLGRSLTLLLAFALCFSLFVFDGFAKPNSNVVVNKTGPEISLYRMNKLNELKPAERKDEKKVVLITFDDAPYSKRTTPKILDVLDKHKVKALFFVNGYLIRQHPDLLRMIHARGHEIGNHTYGHVNLVKAKRPVIEREIAIVQRQVEKLIGQKPIYFRPPYGEYNEMVKQVLVQQHLQMMNWSNDSEDWRERKKPNRIVIERVLKQLRPGSIVLLHDVPGTASSLDELLTKIAERGYKFVHPLQVD